MSEWRFKKAASRYVPSLLLDEAEIWSAMLRHARRLPAVRSNRSLRDAYRNERCFIIGNGPSLRQLDLAKLARERTFTVNTFLPYAAEHGIRPFCHTMIDPIYFDARAPAFADFLEMASRLGDTLAFFPADFAAVVEAHVTRPRYLLFAGSHESNRNADLTRPLPGFYSVNNVALLIALYLGFKEIYLVGCDLDMLSNVVGVAPLRIRESHFYREDKVTDWTAMGFDYATYARSVTRMFEGFKFAAAHVRPHQRVFNATPGGLLDVFPRADYDALFD